MKKNVTRSLLLIFAFVLSIFTGFTPASAAPNSNVLQQKGPPHKAHPQTKTETIQFVSINDFHGNVQENGKNPGIAKIAGVLDEMNKDLPTFFFSAGDNFQGTAISNLTHGAVVNEAFKKMDLQASAIGNHEYDWGSDLMFEWAQEGGYPFLATNIVYKDSGEPVDYAQPYLIKEVMLSTGKWVKIGIIGIATPETAYKTAAANVSDIEFTDPAQATNRWVTYLRKVKRVDAVVALTHLGGFQDSKTGLVTGELKEYAENINGVDLIFSGHTHQTIDATVNGIQILQGYYNGRSLQVAQLTFNNRNRKLTKVDGYVDEIYKRVTELPINLKIDKLVKWYEASVSNILTQPLGTNNQELPHDTSIGLTPLGQWTAKSLAILGGTDMAIINGGGIREPMPAGLITMGTMYSIFPFDNTLVTLEVTGDKLRQLIEHGIKPPTFRDGQFYGVKVKVDLTKPYGTRITEMTLQNGDPVIADQIYSVSTLDFVYTGGDQYDFSGATNVVDTYIPVRSLLAEYIKTLGTLTHVYDASSYVVN